MPINQPPQMTDPVLSVEHVAKLLETPLSTVYKWTRRGYPDYPRSTRLPNGRIVTRLSDVEAWLGERRR